MKVTFNMMSRQVLQNINMNSEMLLQAQSRSSSGKQILKPSDDVSGTGRALSLRSSLSEIEQYLKNSDMVKSQLEVTSSTMDTIVSKLERVQEIAQQATNSAVTDEGRTALVAELNDITTSLAGAGNTQYSGKYIFAGSNSAQQPFVATADPMSPYSYQGNDTIMNVKVSPWTSSPANVVGDRVFNMGSTAVPGSPDVFTMIQTLKQEITAGDGTSISGHLTDIKNNLNNVIAIRSEVGSRIGTLETANSSLLDSQTSLSTLLSKTENVDLAQAILDLQTRQNMYQAAVSTASKILNMSLTNYFQ